MRRILCLMVVLLLPGCTQTLAPDPKPVVAPAVTTSICSSPCSPVDVVHRFYQARANHDDEEVKKLLARNVEAEAAHSLSGSEGEVYDVSNFAVRQVNGASDTFDVDVRSLSIDASEKTVMVRSYQERVEVDATCHCKITKVVKRQPVQATYVGKLIDGTSGFQVSPQTTIGDAKPLEGCNPREIVDFFYHARAQHKEDAAVRYLSKEMQEQTKGNMWSINPRMNSPYSSYVIMETGLGSYKVLSRWAVLDHERLYVSDFEEEVRVEVEQGAQCRITDVHQTTWRTVYSGGIHPSGN